MQADPVEGLSFPMGWPIARVTRFLLMLRQFFYCKDLFSGIVSTNLA